MHKHKINRVLEDSIAAELGIEPGDILVSMNDQEIEDIFDYQYYVTEEELVLVIEKPDGEEWELEIEKDSDEDLGLEFEQGLMDEYKSCRNKCMFCFIDQMPKGMRETLYFKDDDSRLSFLQGNYVTLTNMSDHDIDRIIRFHLEPINVSIHTTNPELRCLMLHNRFAGDALEKIRKLYEHGITMNGQIVLCKGVNDGEELERSIRDMSGWLPHLRSVSVVPVGLTKYREGLYPLEPFGKEDARKVLDLIHRWQDELYEKYGTHFIQAGDEWYLLADYPIPEEERYDGYLQLENGVGMIRLLYNEFEEEMENLEGDRKKRSFSMATGKLASPIMTELVQKMKEKFPELDEHIYTIRNDFFGESITVSGLITGQDLIAQLKGQELGDRLLLPCSMMRDGETVFLDDLTLDDVGEALQIEINLVGSSGWDLIHSILGE